MPVAETGDFSANGGVFGATIGANYQADAFVFGVESDFDASWLNGTSSSTFCGSVGFGSAGQCETKNTWLGTLRARVGYAADRLLIYGTAGGAFGNVQGGFSNGAVSNVTSTGWTVGGGVEIAIAPQWTAKAEYLFVDLANGSCTTDCAIQNPNGPPLIPNIAIKFNESIVRAGVNYKLAW